MTAPAPGQRLFFTARVPIVARERDKAEAHAQHEAYLEYISWGRCHLKGQRARLVETRLRWIEGVSEDYQECTHIVEVVTWPTHSVGRVDTF